MFLARKIARAKWTPKPDWSEGEISADAVTGDLRTHNNSLSFWRCHTETNGDVEEAVLAIAAARDRIDKLDIVWLVDDDLRADGQTLRNSDGRTPIKDLTDKHVDVCKLDYIRLGKVACRVVTAIEDNRWCRLRRTHVKELLLRAIEEGRVELDALAASIQDEIEK